MPIPKDLFDEGIDEFDRIVLDFLENSPDQAYSIVELCEALGVDLEDLPLNARFIDRLGGLESQGKIVGKIIQRIQYYSVP